MAKKVKEDKVKEEKETIEQVEVKEEDVEVIEETPKTLEEINMELLDVIKTLKNDLLKQHADLENVRKRLEKERVLERKYAGQGFAKHLLTPLDNFELALSHLNDDAATKQFSEGFNMIKNQLFKALEEEGVSEIDALNEEYDPNFHQAIMTEKIEGTEANQVLQVLQKGYLFKDRLIRPAIVKISE